MNSRRMTVAILCGLCWPLAGWSQEPAAPKSFNPLKPNQLDIVVSPTNDRFEGKIVSADETRVVFRRKGEKDPVTLKRKDYRIQFWEGVTNAPELLEEVKRIVAALDAMVGAIVLSEGPANEQEVRQLHQDARSMAQRISAKFEEADAAQLLLKKYVDIDLLLKNALEERAIVESQRRRLGNLNRYVKVQLFENVVPELERLRESIQPTNNRVRNTVGMRFLAEFKTLQEIIEQLTELPEVRGVEAIDSLDLDEELTLRKSHIELYQRGTGLVYIGGGTNAAFREKQASAEQALQEVQKMHDLVEPVVEQALVLGAIESEVKEGELTAPNQAAQKLDAIDTAVNLVITDLQKSPQDRTAKYALRQAIRFKDVLGGRKTELLGVLELPLAQQELQRKPKAAQEARELQGILAARMERLRTYAADRRVAKTVEKDLFDVAAKLKTGIDTCKKLELDFLLSDAAKTRDGTRKTLATLNADVEIEDVEMCIKSGRSLLQNLDDLTLQIQKLRAAGAPEDPRENRLRIDGEQIRKEFTQIDGLLDARKSLAMIPEVVNTREILTTAGTLVKSSKARLDAVAGGISPEVDSLRRQTNDEYKSTVRRLEVAEAKVKFDEQDAVLAMTISQTAAHLAANQLKQTGVSLWNARQLQIALGKLVSTHRPLATSAEYPKLVNSRLRTLDDLEKQRTEQITRTRKQAGWLPIPSAGGILVPPTDKNLFLQVVLQLETGDLDEAVRELAKFEKTHSGPAWQVSIAALRGRMALMDARRTEATGDLNAALAKYEQITAQETDQVRLAAAKTSIQNIQATLLLIRDSKRGQLRAAILGGVLLTAMLMTAVWWLRWSERGRLRAIESHLRQATPSANKRIQTASHAHLRQAAEMMSGFPADDPRIAAMKLQFEQRNRGRETIVTKTRDRITSVTPELPGIVLRIVESQQATAKSVDFCLQWLKGGRTTRKLRDRVIEWLQIHLKSELHLDDEELNWRAESLGQLAQILPKSLWPLLYQARALFDSKNFESADRVVLRAIEHTKRHRAKRNEEVELRMIHGRCLIELQQWKEAFDHFNAHIKEKNAPAEVKQWLQVSWARRLSEKHIAIDPEDYERVVPSLLAASAAKETGPS